MTIQEEREIIHELEKTSGFMALTCHEALGICDWNKDRALRWMLDQEIALTAMENDHGNYKYQKG